MSVETDTVSDIVLNGEELPNAVPENDTCSQEPVDQIWQAKEQELQNQLVEYTTTLLQEKAKSETLQKDLQARTEESDQLKKQVVQLEKQLAQNSLKGSKDQDKVSQDMVTKARSVIFEKTKVCKNQELQIEALTQQVKSLKEIVAITKDMLEIRNIEVKQLQDKLECMDLKFTAEKDRQMLVHTKLDRMMQINADLKTEYEKQLKLFSELQEAYKKRQATTNAQENITTNSVQET